MKKTLILCALLGLFLTSMAHPIDLQTAQSVAAKFMGANDLQLSTTYTTDKNATAFYVFNTSEGFVIVSADDCETPIIAYSREGRFNPSNVPVQMEDYLQEFVERIKFGIENHTEADELTARQWKLVKATGRLNDQKNAKSVEPLLNERWHQGHLYNNLCPAFEKVPCGHAEVGCAALAMGMIMHYWKYPTTGWGSHTYSSSGLTLSADFGNTVYDWDNMPDSLTDDSSDAEITAVATLLYHCGVALNMRYSNNVSLANSRDVPNAMFRYFNYSRYLQGVTRGEDNDEWMALLKNDLDSLRPVYYSGQGNVGGHAFVCDGYDENDLLHFNWGWGGSGNGYFALGNLNPNGYGFNDSHYAIFGINPHFEPWLVVATPNPPTAGTIEGNGGYHIGEQCTLTAVPAENCEFNYWKRDGQIISYNTTINITVENDIDNINAYFSYQPIKEIAAHHAPDTNDTNSPYVSLSWDYGYDLDWPLLEVFDINGETGVTTDGEYIYTSKQLYDTKANPILKLRKYTMDGVLVDEFGINGVNTYNIACDGNYLYCGNNHIYSMYLYCLDFTHKTIIDSINMYYRVGRCAYDAETDGFWLSNTAVGNSLTLVNRQGQTIVPSFSIPSSYIIRGFGCISAKDGNPHLLISDAGRRIYTYDISNNSLNNRYIAFNGLELAYGVCVGKYEGKDALFLSAEDKRLYIYEINCHLSRVMHYRLYRSDSQGQIVMLADEYTGASYIDSTWNNASAGTYRFGISEVYFNGVESEIIWSNTIVKNDHGISESIGNVSIVYPNPANDRLIAESPQHIRQCEVFTLEGKLVYCISDCNERLEIQTYNWPSGTYIIRLTGDTFSETKRFIKK